jgi:hypothetical protein
VGTLVLILVITGGYAWWSGRMTALGAIPVFLLGALVGNAGGAGWLIDGLQQAITSTTAFFGHLVG